MYQFTEQEALTLAESHAKKRPTRSTRKPVVKPDNPTLSDISTQVGPTEGQELDLPHIESQDEFDSTWIAKAAQHVFGDRRAAYGHPYYNWQRLQLFWTAIFGTPVSFHQIAYALETMKMCRELTRSHPRSENDIDIIGYQQVLQEVQKMVDQM